jgi:hypothetical protein
MEELKSMQVQI